MRGPIISASVEDTRFFSAEATRFLRGQITKEMSALQRTYGPRARMSNAEHLESSRAAQLSAPLLRELCQVVLRRATRWGLRAHTFPPLRIRCASCFVLSPAQLQAKTIFFVCLSLMLI